MVINCFWHGSDISLLELLTLKSFSNNGYEVHLWRYDAKVDIQCPNGIVFRDAKEIIPFAKLFHYNGNGDCRYGSIGGFSDLFRYYLILKIGGVYVDMDTTCISHFNFEADYIIRPHKRCNTVANIFKAPADCDLLHECIENTEIAVTAENDSWVLPVQIFNNAVEKYKLNSTIVPVDYFGDDDPDMLYKIKQGIYAVDRHLLPKYALHWCKEASYGRWNYRELYNWESPKPLSIYYNLLIKNGLIKN